jgi:hypothetical protein
MNRVWGWAAMLGLVVAGLPSGEAAPIGLPPTVLAKLPQVAGAGEEGYLEWPAGDEAVLRLRAEDHGAVPDDDRPDDAAFVALLAAARQHARPGGHIEVRLPAGRFDFERPLHLDCPRFRLAGAGRDRTVLAFRRPLRSFWKALNFRPSATVDWVTWRGGLVSVAPDPLVLLDLLAAPEPWVGVADAEEGNRTIVLAEALPELKAGDLLVLRYQVTQALAQHIFGHPAGQDIKWEDWPFLDQKQPNEWPWHSRVAAVDGATVTLRDPLRLAIRGGDWPVLATIERRVLTTVILEDFTVSMPRHVAATKEEAKADPTLARYAHLEEAGWNGLFLHGVVGFRVRGLRFRNADIAVATEWAAHGRLADLVAEGDEGHIMHHGITHRLGSNDLLVEDYVQTCQVWHGHSVQDLAAGNVLRRAVFHHGTLECHRGMPFDNLRTDIVFKLCDGRGGGAKGPFCGRRVVSWNLWFDPEGRHSQRGLGVIVNPCQYSMGVLAGIVGMEVAPSDDRLWAMPPGDKGTVVFGGGAPVEPRDLYEWQRTRRPAGP